MRGELACLLPAAEVAEHLALDFSVVVQYWVHNLPLSPSCHPVGLEGNENGHYRADSHTVA